MKTGFYIRFERNGKFENLDIADLTSEEFRGFMISHPSIEGQNWAIAFHKWIIDNVVFEDED